MIRHRLSLEEFQAILEKAPEGLRLELLDGEVYEMAPIGSGHASLVTYLAKQLERLYGDRALVYVQNPLRLSPTPFLSRTWPCSNPGTTSTGPGSPNPKTPSWWWRSASPPGRWTST